MSGRPRLRTLPPPAGDAEIRVALRTYLRRLHRDEPETVLIEELGLQQGRVRADVVVVNGRLHGFEIKSDRDSLRRLVAQVDAYGRVLDRATLVVGSSQFREALETLPLWWEVLVAHSTRAGVRLSRLRRGTENPSRDVRSVVELLWLEDALAMLVARGRVRGVRGRPRRIVWERVLECFDDEEIAAVVRARLKARARPPATPRSQ